MQTVFNQTYDLAKARAFFEDKMAFTTGPVELERAIRSADNYLRIIDVREAEDFAKGHIPGAINLPKGSWENTTALSKDKTNVVYCYSQVCHLAATACLAFAGQGYPVMELEGGFAGWKDGDFDIEYEPANRLKRVADRMLHRRH
jgi:rhodanese-related sulfurtransferase